jgi:uncharacterized protein YndB with AHSA1/START domain
LIKGGEVVHEVVLPVPPAEVFDMFVDADKLVRWIGISADIEARADGRFIRSRGDFQPEDSGRSTRLRLTHRGLPDVERGLLLHDDGWTRFLERLRAAVADEEPPNYPTEQPDERLEQLREQS